MCSPSSSKSRVNRGRTVSSSVFMLNRRNRKEKVRPPRQRAKVEKKKEGTDAKRLRPKADQAVSSVSAAPALVDEYRPPLNQKETELVSEALVYFSDLVF